MILIIPEPTLSAPVRQTLKQLTGVSDEQLKQASQERAVLYSITPFADDWETDIKVLTGLYQCFDDGGFSVCVGDDLHDADKLTKDELYDILNQFKEITKEQTYLMALQEELAASEPRTGH